MASVNGPACEMYKVKPFNDPFLKISVPDCMYKMQNVHMCQSEESPCSPLKQLELRQEAVIERLLALRLKADQITSACTKTACTASSSASTSASTCSMVKKSPVVGVIEDLVIGANPERIPLSLFVLYEVLRTQYDIYPVSYVHSSVHASAVPCRLRQVFAANGVTKERSQCHLAVTLIWKNVEHGSTLMIKPHSQTTLHGEACLVRYLARISSTLRYHDDEAIVATLVDHWLDLASQLLVNGTVKEQNAGLRTMNATLGKQRYLTGDKWTVADIFAWSAVKGQKLNAPANVKQWLDVLDGKVEFQTALKLL